MGRKGRSFQQKEPETGGNVISFPGNPSPILFGGLIREARTREKMSQQDLAVAMGVTRHSIVNWESDKSRPDYDLIPLLCKVLSLSIEDLFGIKPEYDYLEKDIIENIRRMKPATRILASKMVEALFYQEAEDEYNKVRQTTRIIPLESSKAAAGMAGAGVPFNEIAPTPFFLRTNDSNKRADAVLQISGHSMEPDYKNGKLVYFEYTDSACPGDDVVLRWGDTAFVKRLDEDGCPYSINPEFPFEYNGDGSDLRIIGRVLGVITSHDLPPKKYENMLNEMFEEELYEFNAEHGLEE